jgi:uncharacterized iron-regulated protein
MLNFQFVQTKTFYQIVSFLATVLLVSVIVIALPTSGQSDPEHSASGAFIIDLKTGERLTAERLVKNMMAYDVVLLGELHDSPLHHQARAQLIQFLNCPNCAIVSEHLPSGQQLMLSGTLLESLESAGFDAKAWSWPLHEPLFKAIQTQHLTIIGGNIPSKLSSDVFKRGEEAIPASLMNDLNLSSLSEVSKNRLDQDLKDGHCGQLPDKYLPSMRLIQRIKDASFAQLLKDHVPSIFIAGNGHVRKDYGVPQILAVTAPNLKILSVGFIEQDDWTPESQAVLPERYDVVWVSQNTERSDPCKDFSAPHFKK